MRAPDKAAWIRSTLDAYERGLVAYAARITGDLERAQDAVQETFLELCAEDPSRVASHLREWLFSVCRNKALDVRRKESRMELGMNTEERAGPANEAAPDQALEAEETLSGVLASVSALPEAQQEVLLLKFRHGMAYREISRVTGHTVSNVGYLIHMGIKALRAKHACDLQEGALS